MTNKENAGDQVFTNVDQALAERIISRSRKNSKETEPVAYDSAVNPEIDNTIGAYNTDDFPTFRQRSIPVVKIAAAILAALVLMMLIFGSKDKGRD